MIDRVAGDPRARVGVGIFLTALGILFVSVLVGQAVEQASVARGIFALISSAILGTTLGRMWNLHMQLQRDEERRNIDTE